MGVTYRISIENGIFERERKKNRNYFLLFITDFKLLMFLHNNIVKNFRIPYLDVCINCSHSFTIGKMEFIIKKKKKNK